MIINTVSGLVSLKLHDAKIEMPFMITRLRRQTTTFKASEKFWSPERGQPLIFEFWRGAGPKKQEVEKNDTRRYKSSFKGRPPFPAL